MQKILITGGTGFLGQHLINQINKHSRRKFLITVIDKKKNPYPYINIEKFKNIKIHYKDIRDYQSIEKYFQDIDVVYHLAGLVSFYKKDKKKLFEINVNCTKNILKASRKYSVKKVIHISSAAGIGYLNDPQIPADESLKFDFSIVKTKYYMLTKHQSELTALSYFKKGLGVIIVNPGLMYGPGDYFNSIKLISRIINNKLSVITPGGTNVVDVRDVASGLAKLLQKGKFGEKYIMGGYNYSFQQITSIIAKVLKKKNFQPKILSFQYKYFLVPFINFLENILPFRLPITYDLIDSGFKYRYFTSRKAEKEAGYKITIPFYKTIKDTVDWYKTTGLL